MQQRWPRALQGVLFDFAVVYVPALQNVFQTEPLPPATLAAGVVVAAFMLGAMELEKALRRRTHPLTLALGKAESGG